MKSLPHHVDVRCHNDKGTSDVELIKLYMEWLVANVNTPDDWFIQIRILSAADRVVDDLSKVYARVYFKHSHDATIFRLIFAQ